MQDYTQGRIILFSHKFLLQTFSKDWAQPAPRET